MKILTYTTEQKASILAEALVVLMSGGTVVYPTETSYALGADFFSPQAYQRIFKIKKRQKQKPLPVIVPTYVYATTIVAFSPKASELALHYWPGPLTLVEPFRYTSEWPHHADSHLALRVSSHPFALDLTKALGRPIISTSANVSGEGSQFRATDIIKQFDGIEIKPDLIIDWGELPAAQPSTILKDENGSLKVLRKGKVMPPEIA